MKLPLFRLCSLVVVLALGAAVLPASAQDLGAVKARMTKRVSAIDALKEKGAVGENNRGFLEARGDADGAAQVIAAENADRETVYASIAKKTGESADNVGRARARQLASASAPGVWVQKENGTWYKK